MTDCLQHGELVTFVRAELPCVRLVEVVDMHVNEESWDKMPLSSCEIAGVVTSASIGASPGVTRPLEKDQSAIAER